MMSALNLDRIRAFFDEFPFLEKLVQRETVDRVMVARVDVNFLGKKPKYYWVSEIRHIPNERCLLLDKNGCLIKQVPQSGRRQPNYRWWEPSTWSRTCGETVENCLMSMGSAADAIQFVVWIEDEVWAMENEGVEEDLRLVTVYKLAKGAKNLGQWFRDQVEQVHKEIMSSVNS